MKKIYSLCLIITTLFLVGCTSTTTPVVVPKPDVEISISVAEEQYYVGDTIIVDVEINKPELFNLVDLEIISEHDNAEILKNVIVPSVSGSIIVVARLEGNDNVESNELVINIDSSIYNNDPYENMSKEAFYANYKESINVKDSTFRSEHGFMSGNIELPDEEPITAEIQPKIEGQFIRNTNAYYSHNSDAYYITDTYGEIVDVVFKYGGYISLDEVAAHLLAFGDIPANYLASKKGDPKTNPWGEYLRLNNSSFSGSTSKYPYEPELPRISGCGGDLLYYEVDFGTSGTSCDPSYDIEPYNNGSSITRGAARLVYTRFDKNHNQIIDINERYVFYTYNHYNDFQEYLNYQNGWGEIFGNITGGGTLSSKSDYNPTPYVNTHRMDFSAFIVPEESVPEVVAFFERKENWMYC